MINLKNILTEADVFQDPNIDMDKVFMKGKDRNELTDEPTEEVEDLFQDLEKDIKRTDLEPKKVDEALGLTLAGVALSMPEIIKLIGKLVNLVKKIPGFKRLSGDKLIEIGDKYHHKITNAFAFILKKAGVKDPIKAEKFGNILHHVVIALLLIAGGISFKNLAAAGSIKGATLKAVLNAIKAKELRAFIVTTAAEIV